MFKRYIDNLVVATDYIVETFCMLILGAIGLFLSFFLFCLLLFGFGFISEIEKRR